MSADELSQKLLAYEESRTQLSEALSADPGNQEVIQLINDVTEAINLTRDLLASLTKVKTPIYSGSQNQSTKINEVPTISDPLSDFLSQDAEVDDDGEGERAGEGEGEEEDEEDGVSSGRDSEIPVGATVEARYSLDQMWYEAQIVEKLSPNNTYRVTFTGYGNSEVVDRKDIRLKSSREKNSADEFQSEGSSKKSKRKLAALDVSEDGAEIKIPKSLQIHPNDTEEAKAHKRKRIKHLKSQARLKNLEDERNTRKNAWQNFATKTNKPKTGYMTGRKKDSIFKSPESVEGKVGVTGSGKGMTKFTDTRTKYFELKRPEDQ